MALMRNCGVTAWLLALMLMSAAPLVSAQDSVEAPAVLPDPVALKADWWSYFSAAGEALDERIASFKTSFDALVASLTGDSERDEKLRGMVTEVAELALRYKTVLSTKPPEAAPSDRTKDAYSIVELLELSGHQREVVFESSLEHDEIARTARSLERTAKGIENTKAKYFALPSTSPQRLAMGLEIMRARFLYAINTADLEFRRARAGVLKTRAEYLSEALKYAKERLVLDDKNAADWGARAKRAMEQKQQLEMEASNSRMRVSSFGDTTLDRGRRRRLEQQVIELEVRMAAAELTANQASLAERLAAQLHAPGDAQLAALRAQRQSVIQMLGATKESLEGWRRATDRERVAAMTQLADTGATDAQLAEVHRSRITRADESSQEINQLERLMAQVQTLVEAAEFYVLEEGGVTADLWARSVEFMKALGTWTTSWGGKSLFSISETPVTPVGLLRVVIILTVAWWLSRLLRHGLERLMQSRDTMSRASLYTLGRLTHYVILTVALMIALSSIGLDFTKLALFVSALGVGLGFGLQAIFSNFVAGLIILFEKSLKVGDFVELESGVHGEVREINIRGTLITTNDNIDILVPNSEFVSGRVTNWTLREAHRRTRIPFGVAYGSDKELVKKAGLEAADEVPFTLKTSLSRQPQVWLTEFGDSSLNFELVVWLTQEAVKRPSAVNAAYNWAIESALARHGIEIPFPQRDLHVRSYFGHKDDQGLEIVRELQRARGEVGVMPELGR